MRLHIYWLDKNWRSKGAAENVHLYVDYTSKTYQKIINYMCQTSTGSIEAKRKSDILDFIKILQRDGFVEKK